MNRVIAAMVTCLMFLPVSGGTLTAEEEPGEGGISDEEACTLYLKYYRQGDPGVRDRAPCNKEAYDAITKGLACSEAIKSQLEAFKVSRCGGSPTKRPKQDEACTQPSAPVFRERTTFGDCYVASNPNPKGTKCSFQPIFTSQRLGEIKGDTVDAGDSRNVACRTKGDTLNFIRWDRISKSAR